MTPALLYHSGPKWRFAVALFSAAAIHLGAVSLATTRQAEPKTASGFPTDPPEIIIEPTEPITDPPLDFIAPPPTPPVIDPDYVEPTAPPPPARRPTKLMPVVRPQTQTMPSSVHLSSAKAFALNAPGPEYPYEARRQRITGDGIAVMTIDPGTGKVIQVTMAKSTGSEFLDNAAVTGFKRWRFTPGSVSSVTCPVTFTLSGFSY